MSKSVKVKENKPKYFDKFEDIEVGDVVFDECNGPCSGGARYGIGSKVIKITKRMVVIEDGHKFSRKDGGALSEPWAYYIEFWQKG